MAPEVSFSAISETTLVRALLANKLATMSISSSVAFTVLVFGTTFFSSIHVCWGFQVRASLQRASLLIFSGESQRAQRLQLSTRDDDDVVFPDSMDLSADERQRISPPKDLELWLDLRDTALFPKEAISYLNENLDGITPEIIDRVILSEKIMDKVIKQEKENTKDDFISLYVPSYSDDLVMSCQQNQQSIPCGKIIMSKRGVMFNPMSAHEIVIDKGGWILLERNSDVKESDWMEEVSSLMTFLSSSTLSSSTSSSWMLDATPLTPKGSGTGKKNDDNPPIKQYDTPAGNGMAISCPSRSLLVEIGKAILSQTGLPSGTYTSPGGIMLPTSNGALPVLDNGNEILSLDKLLETGNKNNNEKDHLTIALAIPLDIKVWQTAIDLLFTDPGDEDCDDEDEDEQDY